MPLYEVSETGEVLSAVKAWVTYGQGLIIFMNLFLW